MKILDFDFCVSGISFKNRKPNASEYASMRNTFKNKNFKNLEEFKKSIEDGYSYIPAIFYEEGTKKDGTMRTTNDNIYKNTAIVLDFEKSDWTKQKLITYCKKYDIMPNIFYHSFSSTTRAERFRIIYIYNYISPSVFKNMTKLVKMCFDIKISGGIDAASLNATQQYLPTDKNVLILNDNFVDFENFIKCIDAQTKNARKKIEKETEITKIVKNDKKEYEAQIGYYTEKYENNGKFKFNKYKIIGKKTEKDKKNFISDYSNTDADTLIKKCKLIRELMTGRREYYNYALGTGLCYSLVKIRNGKEIFRKICENNASSSWSKKEKIFNDIKKKDYIPQSCQNFNCPFFAECRNNAYSPASLARKSFKNIAQNNISISVDEAREKLKNILLNDFNDDYNTIKIIRAGVGCGKTYQIIDLINENIINFKKNKEAKNAINNLINKKYLTEERKNKEIERIKALISNDEYSFIIASPRHNLCRQIYNDLINKSNINKEDVVYIVPRPAHPFADFETKLAELEKLGILKLNIFKKYLKDAEKIKNIIINLADISNKTDNLNNAFLNIDDENIIKTFKYSLKDYQKLVDFVNDGTEYVNSRENARNAAVVVMTHAFLANCDLNNFNQNVLFIDEDCTESFIETHEINISEIDKMIDVLNYSTYEYRNKAYKHDDFINNLKYIKSKEEGKIYTFSFIDCLKSPKNKKFFQSGLTNKRLEALIDLKREKKLDFTAFLNLKTFYIKNNKVYFATFKNFDSKDKNVILTSATPAPAFLYNKIFNKEIKKDEVGFIKLTGKLIQYIDLSCYRTNLRNEEYLKIIDEIKQKENVKYVISYKSMNKTLKNVLSFGNLEGINELEGQDLLVVGTFLTNPEAIQLITRIFDDNMREYEIEQTRNRKIEFLGYEQNFNTFEDEKMREFQVWNCWKNEEQAVGRARLVCNNCKVVLLSKLIHPQASLVEYNA